MTLADLGIAFDLLNSYLLAGISASGDDGDSADLEELHFVLPVGGRLCAGKGKGFRRQQNRDREFGAKFGVCGLSIWGKRLAGAISRGDCACLSDVGHVRASLLLNHPFLAVERYTSSPHQQLQ